jgi:hypothetical protein
MELKLGRTAYSLVEPTCFSRRQLAKKTSHHEHPHISLLISF